MRGTALLGVVAIGVGGVGALIHPAASLILVAGLTALVLVLADPVNALLAFVIALVVRPAELFPGLASVQPLKVLALVAILSWLVTTLFRGDRRVSKAPQGKWMIALLAGVFLSVVMSTNRAASSQMFTDGFVKLVLLYVLMVQLITTKRSEAKLQFTLAACTVGLALYAVALKFSGQADIEGNRAGFVGMLGDPNDLALVLLMYIPLLGELAFSARGVRRTAAFLGFSILILGVLATVSRGGALGLATALGVGFYDRWPKRLRVLLVPTMAAAVLSLMLVAGLNERNSGAVAGTGIDESSQNRLDAWQAGFRMTKAHPVFGVGLGEFAWSYPAYASSALRWQPTEAHNSFIQVAAETGIVGFIPFLALVLVTFHVAYRLRKLDVPSDDVVARAVRRSLLPAFAGFCVSASLLSQAWNWFFVIMFAQAASMYGIWFKELHAARSNSPEKTTVLEDEDSTQAMIGEDIWKAYTP